MKLISISLIITIALISCASSKSVDNNKKQISFSEVWGYLMKGEEKEIFGHEPFTHVFYFSVSPDSRGRIKSTIDRPDITLANGFKPSIHLVIADLSNYSLMHFSLSKTYSVRDLLIDDIIRISDKFDGVQIDFEAVSPGDAEDFHEFLKILREKLNRDKMLSVAVPARIKFVNDAYRYEAIAPFVDRIVIMAYDQHWSTSNPGPVASLSWCMDVVAYAKRVLPKDKIIMGLPLYGRAWQDKKLHRAVRHHQVEDLLKTIKKRSVSVEDSIPRFEYTERVKVIVYYDDEISIVQKLFAYKNENIDAVSFWRIGQGPRGLWNYFIR